MKKLSFSLMFTLMVINAIFHANDFSLDNRIVNSTFLPACLPCVCGPDDSVCYLKAFASDGLEELR
jgi:hypothetical protein